MKPKDTIHIMADYGMSPYAWLRRAGNTRGVGGNIADACSGFPEEYNVSKDLEKAFAKWAIYFEQTVEPGRDNNFDWETFHRKGHELTKRLEKEIGDRFNVRYIIPWEDPESERQWNFCRWKIRYMVEKIKEVMLNESSNNTKDNEK
jgi:hypothetical protein